MAILHYQKLGRFINIDDGFPLDDPDDSETDASETTEGGEPENIDSIAEDIEDAKVDGDDADPL